MSKGKFEGTPDYAEYFWDLTACSGEDDLAYGADGTLYSIFKVTKADRQRFDIPKDTKYIVLWECQQGFVNTAEFETLDDVDEFCGFDEYWGYA